MKFQRIRAWWNSVAGRLFESERQYVRECENRLRLTDDQFLATYYSSGGIRRDVPLRVRRLFKEQLGFDKIVPADCPSEILQDIDLQVILDEVADEFGISLAVDELPDDSGSFDSIVKLVNSKMI